MIEVKDILNKDWNSLNDAYIIEFWIDSGNSQKNYDKHKARKYG